MPKEKTKRSKSAGAKSAAKSKSARVRKTTRKQDKTKAKKEAKSRSSLPNSFKLAIDTVLIIKKFWRPLSGVLLIYLVLNLIFASGLISNLSGKVSDISENIKSSTANHESKISQAVDGFGLLIAGDSASSDYSSTQSAVLIIGSLAIIWALRQLLAGKQIGIKQAYYHSMTPLIPFLLVIIVIVIQSLPLLIGTTALSLVLNGATSDSASVTSAFILLFVAFAAWSLYMLSSSIFAMYIVTLPNVYPLSALRSAKNLVRFRRWQIMRKILFLPIFIFFVMGLVIVPLLIFASFLVVPAFFALSVLTVLFVHTYLYSLYKELLS